MRANDFRFALELRHRAMLSALRICAKAGHLNYDISIIVPCAKIFEPKTDSIDQSLRSKVEGPMRRAPISQVEEIGIENG